MESDPHRVLGVPYGASLEEIKRAFRKLAKETHPDLGATGSDVERFQRGQRAYRELRRRIHARNEAAAQRPSPDERREPTRPPDETPPRRTTSSPWIELKREEAALSLGEDLAAALEIRPRRMPTILVQLSVVTLAMGMLVAPRASWLAMPTERRQLLAFLILILTAFVARNVWLHVRKRERVCLTEIGLYIVEGRRVTTVPLEDIRQIDFGYDPITRLGFRPFSLRVHHAFDRPPVRIPSCYGERELRRLAGWTYDRSRGLRAT